MPISANVTFDPGEENKEVLVSIFGDTSGEDPETFEVLIHVFQKNTVINKPDITTVTIHDAKTDSRSNIKYLSPQGVHAK